ncbi:probable thiol methyltransferase 2 isoform X2 [Miscanthus floridulus]|uniref:probable thiol methyltransferase 2 isoform X2 n=1 Tax=Miscanthus floridulus TaxID=154761 RepID=UPI00345AD066
MAMASTAIAGGGQVLNVSNPAVVRVRQLIGGTAEYSSDGWRRCWEEGVTPWDLGQPTPAVVDLVNSGTLPGGDHDGRATTVLVPGCGAGHDVVALSGAGRFVVGLDISEAAIHKARQRAAAADGNSFDFVAADFFTWEPPDKFDIIFDYTFFCAFEPSMRPAWAKRIADLLKQDGELITLMYLLRGGAESLGFGHEQHPRQRGGSPITKGNGKNGKVEEDGKPNQLEFCRRDTD